MNGLSFSNDLQPLNISGRVKTLMTIKCSLGEELWVWVGPGSLTLRLGMKWKKLLSLSVSYRPFTALLSFPRVRRLSSQQGIELHLTLSSDGLVITTISQVSAINKFSVAHRHEWLTARTHKISFRSTLLKALAFKL